MEILIVILIAWGILMTEKKRNSNPFIRMAQQVKESEISSVLPDQPRHPINTKIPKPTKGFGSKIIKKTGRA